MSVRVARRRPGPNDILRKHFERGMGESAGLVRVKQTLRDKVQYRRLNLLEINSPRSDVRRHLLPQRDDLHFDIGSSSVVSMLERHLRPGGYLFISHSESLNGSNHRFRGGLLPRPIRRRAHEPDHGGGPAVMACRCRRSNARSSSASANWPCRTMSTGYRHPRARQLRDRVSLRPVAGSAG